MIDIKQGLVVGAVAVVAVGGGALLGRNTAPTVAPQAAPAVAPRLLPAPSATPPAEVCHKVCSKPLQAGPDPFGSGRCETICPGVK